MRSEPAAPVVAAHQVHFLPWLRYVHKALYSHRFVLLDDVQFVKGDWHNRNKLKGPQGAYILTVPVRHRLGQRLNEVEIDQSSNWQRKHLASLRHSYSRAAAFAGVFPLIEDVYAAGPWKRLEPFSSALLEVLFPLCGVTAKVLRSSELDQPGRATERLARICRSVGARSYLSGSFASRQYLDEDTLRQAQIVPVYQRWQPPHYDQVYPEAGFVPDLCVLDLLMVAGSGTRDILLQSGGTTPEAPSA